MRVKGRSADVRTIQNFFHDNIVVSLFVEQRDQRFVQQLSRLLNTPIADLLFRWPLRELHGITSMFCKRYRTKTGVLSAIAHFGGVVLPLNSVQSLS